METSQTKLRNTYKVDIKKLEVIKSLNVGAFGKVYLVHDRVSRQKYAAKVISYSSEEESFKKQINNEISIMIRIRHPTLISFYGYSLEDFDGQKNVTILMEYHEKGSLAEYLKKVQLCQADPLYDNTIRQIILIGIVRGMMFLHQNHVIHRDLKPANILLDDDFHPHIIDFGLSKFKEDYKTARSIHQCGTTIYMAPETIKNNEYSIKSDVYSFAILMFEVVTDQIVYPELKNGEINNFEFQRRVAYDNYRPVFNVHIKKSIKELIERCWSNDPNDRPTFDELFNKLSFNNEKWIIDVYDGKETENEYDVHKYFLENVDTEAILDYVDEIREISPTEILMRENREFKDKMKELQHSIKVKDDDIEQLKKSQREQNELIKSIMKKIDDEKEMRDEEFNKQFQTTLESGADTKFEEIHSEIKSLKSQMMALQADFNVTNFNVKKLNKELQNSSVLRDEELNKQSQTTLKSVADTKFEEIHSEIESLKSQMMTLRGDFQVTNFNVKKLQKSSQNSSTLRDEELNKQSQTTLESVADTKFEEIHSEIKSLKSQMMTLQADFNVTNFNVKKLNKELQNSSVLRDEELNKQSQTTLKSVADTKFEEIHSEIESLKSQMIILQADLHVTNFNVKKLQKASQNSSTLRDEELNKQSQTTLESGADTKFEEIHSEIKSLKSQMMTLRGDFQVTNFNVKKLQKASQNSSTLNSSDLIELKEEIKNQNDKINDLNEYLTQNIGKSQISVPKSSDIFEKEHQKQLNDKNSQTKGMLVQTKSEMKYNKQNIIVAGKNNYNQLGKSANNKIDIYPIIGPPLHLPIDSSSLLSYSVGSHHSVLITNSGSLLGIGYNKDGRISGSFKKAIINEFTEFSIKDDKGFNLIPVSAVCTSNSTLYMFSKCKSRGMQLVYCSSGINDGNPVFLDIGNHEPVALFGGYLHSAAISQEGKVIFFNSKLIIKSPKSQIAAVSLPDDEKASSIACGSDLIVVLSSNGRVFSSIIKESSNALKFSPIEEFAGEKIVCISGTNRHFLAVSTEGSVFCYGSNSSTQLGFSQSIEYFSSFTKIQSLKKYKIRAVYAGIAHSLFETQEGKILSCGSNTYGQLLISSGPGEEVNSPTETAIESGATFCIAGCAVSVVFVGNEPPINTPNRQIQYH